MTMLRAHVHVDDVERRLDELAARLSRVEERLEARASGRDEDDQRVLAAVARVVGDAVRFSAAEVVRHARVDTALAAALARADCDENPRSLGRCFRRLERRGAVDGLTVARVGADASGLVWRIR